MEAERLRVASHGKSSLHNIIFYIKKNSVSISPALCASLEGLCSKQIPLAI